jgi:PAS domain S-box-containing protein
MAETAERRAVLRRTEDIYRKAIEDIRDYAIFMTDPAGVITNWNAGARYILGYSENEIIGTNAAKFFTPEDRAKDVPRKELATAAAEGRAEDERWHMRRDGSRFWASGVVTPVRDESGELIGFTKVMRDMTERNKLTEERDRFFALSMDMLCIVHLDGRFQRVNPAFQKILGFSEEELLATSIPELVHPDDLAGTLSGYEKLSAGKPIQFMENRLRCKDGAYRWVAWSYFPVPEDGLAFGVGRDISELRQMHEMLRLRADELENANRVKDEFLATMSHELRTPLTSILGWTRLLDSDQVSDADKKRAVAIIQRNAEAQANLIEDLLDVSRIISGKLKFEVQPVSFAEITEAVVNSLRPAVDARQIQLETEIDPTAGPILGDPERLQQIVTNLISNAVKFTPEGGKIEVRLQRSGAQIRLEVSDTGVGIPAEHMPHIFERFRQADSSSIRAHGGLGLGLAIVDYLVRQQQGSVSAHSEGVGRGATFTVEFPLTNIADGHGSAGDLYSADSMQTIGNAEPEINAKLANCRILVVEDHADTRYLLETVLQRKGADVRCVASAANALTEIPRVKPDLIISDIGMAGQNGYDLIREIRSLSPEAGGHTPAIALTAYAGPADRRRALLSGFQAHVAKPIDQAELLAVILSLTFQQHSGSAQAEAG